MSTTKSTPTKPTGTPLPKTSPLLQPTFASRQKTTTTATMSNPVPRPRVASVALTSGTKTMPTRMDRPRPASMTFSSAPFSAGQLRAPSPQITVDMASGLSRDISPTSEPSNPPSRSPSPLSSTSDFSSISQHMSGIPRSDSGARRVQPSPLAHRAQTASAPVRPDRTLSEGEITDKYAMGEKIGTGAFSKVYLGSNKLTGQNVAIKVISRSKIVNSQKQLMNEARIMRQVHHDNIVHVFDVYQDPEKFYMVMEYIPHGDFGTYLQEKGALDETEAARLIVQLASGLDYLHHIGIVHRDLKPDNVLVGDCEDGICLKIADFGLSKLNDRDDDSSSSDDRIRTPCGTPLYMAPEVLKKKGYDRTVDLWSLGCILYTMLSGYTPFQEDNQARLFEKIMSANYDFPPKEWSNVSSSAKDLISRLLVVTPSSRYGCSEVINHPWTLGLEERPQPTVLEMMRGFALGLRLRRAMCAVTTCLRMMKIITRSRTTSKRGSLTRRISGNALTAGILSRQPAS